MQYDKINLKTGTILTAKRDYFSKMTGNILFTKGSKYEVRMGTNGIAYAVTDRGRSRALSPGILEDVFKIAEDRYDYAMAII